MPYSTMASERCLNGKRFDSQATLHQWVYVDASESLAQSEKIQHGYDITQNLGFLQILGGLDLEALAKWSVQRSSTNVR